MNFETYYCYTKCENGLVDEKKDRYKSRMRHRKHDTHPSKENNDKRRYM